jgi:hypothetical protein
MGHCRRRFVRALEAGDARAAVAVVVLREIDAVEARERANGSIATNSGTAGNATADRSSSAFIG